MKKGNTRKAPPPLLLQGFTLAEILITLVIIGVIAAFTIPNVINTTKKQEYVSSLKKTYSTLATVTNKIINDEGLPRADIGGWATSHEAVFNLYKKYLTYVKECPSGTDGCYGQGGHKQLNSSGNDPTWGHNSFPKLILSDGVQLIFIQRSNNCSWSENWIGSSDVCVTIGVDVNGEKPPNIWGRDAFVFIVKEDGIHPSGCDGGLCPSSSGKDCTCRVLRESAINY